MKEDKMLELSKNLLETSKNHDSAIKNIVKEVTAIKQDTGELRQEFIDLKNQLPITGTQRKILRKAVRKKVRSILGSAGNPSRRGIAYGWAYGRLEPYGYSDMDSTPRDYFEPIMQALPYAIDFTLEEVKIREEQVQEEKRKANL